ncbi:MAG: hypothetical protein R2787_09975 [Saprospiraceae bacterium]
MIHPVRILALMALVFGLTSLLMLVIPPDGVRVGPVTVDFPTWERFLAEDTTTNGVSLEDLFAIYAQKEQDGARTVDSLEQERRFRLAMKHFQYPQRDSCTLDHFFSSLPSLSRKGRVRILHYGDSQIEGNRITAQLQFWFQAQYGGRGPGWIPVVEIIRTFAADQRQSDNWIRYTRYGGGPVSGHDRYGLLGAFSRFSPALPGQDSLLPPSSTDGPYTAWLEVAPRRGAIGRYDRLRLAWGDAVDTVHYSVMAGEELIDEGIWPPGEGMHSQSWVLGSPPPALRMSFRSASSPNFYGMSLETDKGVFVDNIPLRGSSGTEFTRIQPGSITDQVGTDDVAMVIYQFGGNTLPNTTNQEQVDYYQRVVIAQLARVRRLFPEATLLVIGPSDMSIKDGDRLVTHPYLPAVRDAVKAAAFDQGAIFWDMYEAMGGRNSMVQWVDAEPALATTDYTHFTIEGCQVIADWLIEAFEEARTITQGPVQ